MDVESVTEMKQPGEVEEVHGDVEGVMEMKQPGDVGRGRWRCGGAPWRGVEELEKEFETVYTTIEVLFEKVDRATKVETGESKISARYNYIRSTNLAMLRKATVQSSCDGCMLPAMCRSCGVRGEALIFRCNACTMPVPKDLVPCELCGNPLVCDDYWCKTACYSSHYLLLQPRHIQKYLIMILVITFSFNLDTYKNI
jgi:hypothetical protein